METGNSVHKKLEKCEQRLKNNMHFGHSRFFKRTVVSKTIRRVRRPIIRKIGFRWK